MSNSAPLTIAILGVSGTLGPFLLQAISAHPMATDVHIRVLTRHTSLQKVHNITEAYGNLHLTVHTIDYSATDTDTSLGAALRGVDVVVSAVGDDSGLTSKDVAHTGLLPGFIAQDTVARAAKTAGVRLFVPSEYGAPTHTIGLNSPHYVVGKRHHIELLRTLKLPYLLMYSSTHRQPAFQAPTPLPPLDASAPIPLGEPPFETTRYHVATYVVQLILDRGIDVVAGGIYVLRGLRRDRGVVLDKETWKTEWVLDV
ncbi:hypothetical protein B0H11DRAFT_1896797 [Mycena galericulata]|nr:hypothetical protein B0H11DRAFT_1896797 [Mycena galericulata]